MGALALEGLNVLVTGVEASLSRDVVRLFTAQGASVMAADNDIGKLARLERDVSLYRSRVEAAPINTGSVSEMRLFEENLRLLRKLPHLMICCCAAHGPVRKGQDRTREVSAKPRPVCAGALAAQILQPSLFLHVEPVRPGALGPLGKAISALAYPTLLAVLERKPGRGIFNPDAFVPYVRIASHIYSLQRQMDAAAAPQNSSGPNGSVRAFSPPRRRRQASPDLTTSAPRATAA
jgi:NAD(P)-dependent dehydrogenase (short-subunit alcohol dehydrogenase family)